MRGAFATVCVLALVVGSSRAAGQEPPAAPGPAERLESLARGEVGEGRRGGEEIETDRDSFTPATTTAPRRRLITEAAYTFSDNRGFKESHSFPELLLRYGLTERVELRFGANYEVGGEGEDVSGSTAAEEFAGSGLERVSSLSYGIKVRVIDQDRWIPRSAVILQAATPVSGRDTKTDFFAAWVCGWELPNRWRLDASFRYGAEGEPDDHFNLWAPSAVLKIPLGEKWAVHAEYFGIVSTGRADNFSRHYFSPGAHYLVTPDLEVGVRVGWGLNDQTARFFVNAGFGWQF